MRGTQLWAHLWQSKPRESWSSRNLTMVSLITSTLSFKKLKNFIPNMEILSSKFSMKLLAFKRKLINTRSLMLSQELMKTTKLQVYTLQTPITRLLQENMFLDISMLIVWGFSRKMESESLLFLLPDSWTLNLSIMKDSVLNTMQKSN